MTGSAPLARRVFAARHPLAVAISRASLSVHGKTFALASRFLPAGLSDDAAVVYAFCRRADDAVDLAPRAEQAERAVALRRELDGIYAGVAQRDPVLGGFQSLVAARGIPEQYPGELLAGIEMDALGLRYESIDALLGYCYRVAGTVGLMMSHVLGVRHPGALRNAAHLGIAMQLTNIARDVREDFGRGRLYLPAALLGGSATALSARGGGALPVSARADVSSATLALLERAEPYYTSADRGIPALPLRAAVAVRAARLIYADIGRVIAERGADPFAPRAVVGSGRKLLLAMRALAATLPAAVLGYHGPELAIPFRCSDVVRL